MVNYRNEIELKKERLNEVWRKIVGENIDPNADRLKILLKDKWVRFHSLPNSKRYPENEEEEQEVISRANSILSSVFKEGDEIFLVRSVWSSNSEKPLLLDDEGLFWKSWIVDSDGIEYALGHAYIYLRKWRLGIFDKILLDVAHDRESNLMILNERRGVIYHPYDGGCDLVVESASKLFELRSIHSDYLSSHPSGL
jgi:hypothetical protein